MSTAGAESMDLDQKLQSRHIYDAFARLQKKDFDGAEAILNEGVEEAQAAEDTALLALLYSSLGVLYKLKKDFRQAWRFYDQAEKLLPENPVFKLISARLLIESFSQHDIAIRKMEKVEALDLNDPLVAHQMNATYGLAYARKGNKLKAREYLSKLLADGFGALVSAGNIDFKLIEVCVRKGWNKDLCDQYLLNALAFAKTTQEDHYIRLFEKLLKAAQKEETRVV